MNSEDLGHRFGVWTNLMEAIATEKTNRAVYWWDAAGSQLFISQPNPSLQFVLNLASGAFIFESLGWTLAFPEKVALYFLEINEQIL